MNAKTATKPADKAAERAALDEAARKQAGEETKLPAPVAVVARGLEGMAAQFAHSLPRHITPERFIRLCLTAIQNMPELLECDRHSLYLACQECAQDGLMPDGRQAAIVPFKEKQPDGPLQKDRDLHAHVSGHPHACARSGRDVLRHRELCARARSLLRRRERPGAHRARARARSARDRGNIVGAYAIFRDENRRVIHREIMERKEIEKVRNVSRAKDGPAWRDWFEEMARKTVIRRGSKYVPMSEGLRKVIERDDRFIDLEAVKPAGERPKVRDVGQMLDRFGGSKAIKHRPQGDEQETQGEARQEQQPEPEQQGSQALRDAADNAVTATTEDADEFVDDDQPEGEQAAAVVEWPKDKVPTTADEYAQYARWVIHTTTDNSLPKWWGSGEQKTLRNRCNVTPELREQLKAEASVKHNANVAASKQG